MSRKPWEIPIQYNDWFPDEPEKKPAEANPAPSNREEVEKEVADRMREAYGDNAFGEGEFGIDEDDLGLMDADERGPDTQSQDNEPIDYTRGPHDDEFGIDEDYDPEDGRWSIF